MGGLGEGFTTVPYVSGLADALEDWSVVEVLTTSSYYGWGMGSLKRDVEELSQAVAYIKQIRPHGRVVLLGHSTGSQDAIEYISKPAAGAPDLDGAIFQAPVSDREAMRYLMGDESYYEALDFVTKWVAEGLGEEIIPIKYRGPFAAYPITARRWYSLLVPLGPDGIPRGDDDYWSSDISEDVVRSVYERVTAETKLLYLFSGDDEYMSSSLDKEALLQKWYRAAAAAGVTVDTENSGTVAKANHRYEDVPEGVTQDLYGRVKRFLEGLGSDLK
ncbi:uncharacterized protein H6S33_006791 [Morchella sextelata]|uniref:uncharacterized protein n=1 Tax=Morchella sextelata TaxID=1174677 RepID=UPI001D039D30|nr:uncharacterized protein H6S33_006791 [Morchella sextelata]KAH0604414.1 hypothetical protein H6S33_006791 [Morchella sextelata]